MPIKQIRKNRVNSAGSYDVIHYETDANIVLMQDGTTVEDAITELLDNPSAPAGGTTGQVLVKKSDADHDTEWTDVTVLPSIATDDNGKFLRVVDGAIALVALTNVSEVGA